jgi:hypothetical protein
MKTYGEAARFYLVFTAAQVRRRRRSTRRSTYGVVKSMSIPTCNTLHTRGRRADVHGIFSSAQARSRLLS